MPVDPRKRQKKQERRASKRKAKQHQLAKEKSAGLPERLTAAARFPVRDCWVSEDLWNQGLGYVILSRQLPNGMVAFVNFLVDRYCLGVKDALATIIHESEYEKFVRDMFSRFDLEKWDPPAARKLVEDAVAYAANIGFRPHPDYHKAKLIFGDIDASACQEEFEFGQDGKPTFIAGPHDTPQRCRQILQILEQHCGPDNYHFLVPFSSGVGHILPDEVKQRGAKLIGHDKDGVFLEQDVDFPDEEEEPEEPGDESPGR
ncbi:MAG: hypothetical protein JO112_00910 [Planctomycetes bacterium]|nr:hypothetical protein [Planctomycetota bacterium]